MHREISRALVTGLGAASLAFLIWAALPALAAQKEKPLNQREVTALLEGGAPSRRVSEIVDERGIDFAFTAEIEQKIRDAGGHDDLVTALRRASQRRSAPDLPAPAAAIPIPGVKISALQFFEGPPNLTLEQSQRVYRFSFDRFTTRSIYWELDLTFPAPGRRIDFQADAVWYKSDGAEMTRQTISGHVEADWHSSWHSLGFGYVEPGHWTPGTYRVDLYGKSARIATGTFQIN